MKLLLATHEGLCEALKLELKKFGLTAEQEGRSYVIVETDNSADILIGMQTIIECIELKGSFTFEDYNDIDVKFAKESDFESPGKYNLRCTRVGEHEFKSPDVVQAVQEIAHKKIKAGHGPQSIIRFYVEDNTCHYGVDLAGTDLSKRDYRIFRHQASVKGTVAAALVALCEVNSKDIIVDPFCKDGTIAIETAFWLGRSKVRRFSWESLAISKQLKIPTYNITKGNIITAIDSSNHNLSYARKNMQIAGLKDSIKLVREEVDWLSTRFEKIDKIMTLAPATSQRTDDKIIKRLYDELFDNTKEILGKGLIGAIITTPELYLSTAEEKGLKLHKRVDFSTGKQKHTIIILKK